MGFEKYVFIVKEDVVCFMKMNFLLYGRGLVGVNVEDCVLVRSNRFWYEIYVRGFF